MSQSLSRRSGNDYDEPDEFERLDDEGSYRGVDDAFDNPEDEDLDEDLGGGEEDEDDFDEDEDDYEEDDGEDEAYW